VSWQVLNKSLQLDNNSAMLAAGKSEENAELPRKIWYSAGKPLGTDGGAEGVRTPDLLNAIQALYQLSYDPIRSGDKSKTLPGFVKGILNF
jgi:hypothetical protein